MTIIDEASLKTLWRKSIHMARGGRQSVEKGGKVKGLDKYGSWYYMDDDGTLFVRYQE